MAPNLSHDPASTGFEQLQVRASVDHLLMLAAGAQQPADTSATQVGTSSRSHSPSNPRTNDLVVNTAVADAYNASADMPIEDPDHALLGMLVAEPGRESDPAANSAGSTSGYSTPGKLRLRLPGFSSAMLAAGSTALSAETEVGSPPQFVSVLAY